MNASATKWLLLVLSVLGLADSWYLAESALTDTPLVCGIENLDGCNIVAQSAYSHLFGIPLGVYGLLFYGLVIVVTLTALTRMPSLVRTTLFVLGIAGLVASAIFVGIQLLLIKAICVYCLGSALLCLGIFVLSHKLWREKGELPSLPAEAVVS